MATRMISSVLILASVVFTSHSKEDGDKKQQLASLVLAMNPPVARQGNRIVSSSRVQVPQMKVAMKDIKKLKDETGVGLVDCQKAIEAADGDLEAALTELRKKGLAKAEKRAGRSTGQGAIVSYIHSAGNVGVMVEVACETDFVAKNEDFQQFGKNIAMQVAAFADIEYVDEDSIDPAYIEKEREIAMASEDLAGKPDEIKAKMVDGRMGKIMKTKVLTAYDYIKDDSMSVDQYIKTVSVKFGENIKVVRFTRYQVGETSKEE